MPQTADLFDISNLSNHTPGQCDPIVIDVNGDLLLRVTRGEDKFQDYRVCVGILRRESRYFDALLDPSKFSEGQEVELKLRGLRKGSQDTASIPPSNLPKVVIMDARPRLHKSEKYSSSVLTWFLSILHRAETDWLGTKKISSKPTLLALLMVYADMFASVPVISRYVSMNCEKELKFDNPDLDQRVEEEIIRRKLYVGMILDHGLWVHTYSTFLIVWGSKKWLDSHDNSAAHGAEEPPWNYLAGGVEGNGIAETLEAR